MRARGTSVALVALALAAGCTRTANKDVAPPPRAVERRAAAPTESAIIGDYAVRWDPERGDLHVTARFESGAGASLVVDRGAEAFVHDAEAAPDRDGARYSAIARRGRVFESTVCAESCRIRYRYALRAAARRIDDVDVATDEGPVIEAPPSTWLLWPARAPRDARIRFRVTTPEGERFVTGAFRSHAVEGAWDMSLDDLSTAPYSAFGPFRVRAVSAGGATLDLAIGPGKLAVTDDDLALWTETAARAVSTYLGRFPMPTALVLLVAARGHWVGGGRTLGGGGGSVFMRCGDRAQKAEFAEDSVLVHEMIHLTFPSVPKEQDWAEEGLATYVEPFARARAGMISAADAWRGMASGLPNGLPGPHDRGLDRTPTWGRIYWGGALFYLLADVAIRKRTHNRFGLEHALRGILDAGGSNAVRWDLDTTFAAGDRATGVPVLRELHDAMGTSPYPVDLGALLESLGVEVFRGKVRFNDRAPLAHIRKAITSGT